MPKSKGEAAYAERAIAVDEDTGAPLLRTSERNDFKRCPWLWEQTWLNGLRSRREPTWAWFGTAIHRALEARYPVGKKRAPVGEMLEAFEAALDGQTRRIYTEGGEIDEQEIVDARELGRAMLLGFVEAYGEDNQWQVLHTEQPFQINVPHPVDKDRVLVVYAGTWDLAVWDLVDKVYKIVDWKTRKTFPSNWSFYGINDQAGSYLWVAKEVLVHKGILKPKDEIGSLVFSALKKAMPDPRPLNAQGQALNKDGSVSKVQPTPRFHREEVYADDRKRVAQARKVQAEAIVMEEMRSGRLPIFKNPNEDCTRCQLFEYCELNDINPEEAAEFAKYTLVKRDPYRDHREDMTRGGVRL